MTRDITLNRPANRAVDASFGLFLAGLTLALYGATLAPTVLMADSGEFQFVLWLPGIAHPTGYPLYTLLGWLWSHALPFGEVARRINFFSAVTAAAAVGAVYAVALGLFERVLPETSAPARRIGAWATAATFAVTRTFWSQAIIAEVYALHALFVALVLWLCLKWLSSPSRGLRLALAFSYGLSLTHHRTMLLLLPAILVFRFARPRAGAANSLREGTRPGEWRRWAASPATALLAFALPLLLYLYLPLIAPATPYATLDLGPGQTLTLYDNSLRGFWDHVWGTVFATQLQPAHALEQIALAWQLLRAQVGWIGLGLGLLGLGRLLSGKDWAVLALTGLSFAALVAFNVIYAIGDIFVLFIPAWLILCLWIGLGGLALSHWLAGRVTQAKRSVVEEPNIGRISARLASGVEGLLTAILVSALLILPLILLVTRYAGVDQSRNTLARDGWQRLLAAPIPENAILLSNDRNEIMPLWYYQYVEGRRPDLQGLFPLIVTDPDYANVGRVLDRALASGRPVYLIKPMPGLALKADLTPEGPLFRARALPATPARSEPHEFGGLLRLLGYDLAPDAARAGETVAVSLYWQARQPLPLDYSTFVHLVDENLRGISQDDHQPGDVYYPTHLWQAGETLRDTHRLVLPEDLPEGEYRLLVGVYHQPAAGVIEPLGEAQVIGAITVR